MENVKIESNQSKYYSFFYSFYISYQNFIIINFILKYWNNFMSDAKEIEEII